MCVCMDVYVYKYDLCMVTKRRQTLISVSHKALDIISPGLLWFPHCQHPLLCGLRSWFSVRVRWLAGPDSERETKARTLFEKVAIGELLLLIGQNAVMWQYLAMV